MHGARGRGAIRFAFSTTSVFDTSRPPSLVYCRLESILNRYRIVLLAAKHVRRGPNLKSDKICLRRRAWCVCPRRRPASGVGYSYFQPFQLHPFAWIFVKPIHLNRTAFQDLVRLVPHHPPSFKIILVDRMTQRFFNNLIKYAYAPPWVRTHPHRLRSTQTSRKSLG